MSEEKKEYYWRCRVCGEGGDTTESHDVHVGKYKNSPLKAVIEEFVA